MAAPTLHAVGSSEHSLTRADGDDDYTVRFDTSFYPGEPRTEKYADINGDGILDVIIISREMNGSDVTYYMFIFSLDDGELLFNQTFLLEDGAYVDLIEVDGDPTPELMVQERRQRHNRGRLFILDPPTYQILFDTGYIDGYFQGKVIGDEFFLTTCNDPYSYTPSRDVWFSAYSLSNWTMVWRTMRFPRASGRIVDLDNDGIEEYIYTATWVDTAPNKAHIYFIDLDAHQVTLNSTDMEHLNYWGGGRSAMDYHDIDGDGYTEMVAVARWTDNSTCKAFLYSASTNDTVWVTRSLGDYSLREEIDWVDITGDGVDEMIMILSDPLDDLTSKLVVLDPLTGDVLLEEQMNDRFHPGNVKVNDVNGDGNLDLLFFNYTSYRDGVFRIKLSEPSNGWALSYDVTIPDMRGFQVEDMDNDDIVDIVILGSGSTSQEGMVDLRRYDPADMTMEFSVGDFSTGPEGDYAWSRVYMGRYRSLNVIDIDYRNSSGGNYSQLHIVNATTGTLEYSSDKIFGELDTDIRFQSYFFNGDTIEDMLIGAEWRDTGDSYSRLNLSIVDLETFEVRWEAGPFLDPYYWQTSNGSFQYWRGLREVYVRFSDGVQDLWHHYLFDINGDAPRVVYEVEDNVEHDLSEIDPDQNGEFLLEDITSEGGILNITYYEVGVGIMPSQVSFFQLEGNYANGKAVDAAKDGDTILIYRTGSNPSRVYYIDPSDFTVINMLRFDSYGHTTIDPDQDKVKEDVWIQITDHGSTGYVNITFFDMETGLIEWQQIGLDYDISIELMDVEGDRRMEMLFFKERFWSEPYRFGLTVYNVSTDLPPDLIAPIDEVQMVEDGPSVVLDLDDHFSDEEGPLTFTLEDPDSAVLWNIDDTSNELELTPAPDVFGRHPLILHVMDAFWDITYRFHVNITPVNDPPVLVNVSGYEPVNGTVTVPVEQEEENLLQVNVLDVDGDALEYSFSEGHNERAYIYNSTGLIEYMPLPEDGPETLFSVNVSDGTEFLNFQLVTVNRRKAHPPFDVNITSPENGTSSYGGWTFTATADDVDIPWGDLLTFNWTSDRDGYLGLGEELQVDGLSPGDHVITLNVTDTDGFSVTASIDIEVLPFVRFENLTGLEPTADLSLEIDVCRVDAYFKMINGTTLATYDLLINGSGDPDMQVVMLYIRVPTDGEYIPFDPVQEGHAEAEVVDGLWEYGRTYTIQLPGSNHSEGDLSSIQFGLGAVGWDPMGNYDIAYKEAEMSHTFENISDDDDDVGPDDDDSTDDDDTSEDDDAVAVEKEGLDLVIIILLVIIVLLVIIAIVVYAITRRTKEEKTLEWGEE